MATWRRLAPVLTLPAPRLRTVALFLLLTGAMAGCSVGSQLVNPQLQDRVFLSVGVTDDGVDRPLVAGTRIRLDFHASELSANAGCNHMGGTYRVESSRLVFESGGMTAMACDQPVMAQDAWLIEFLSGSPTLSLVGNELTLASGSTVVRLMDREVADPDIAITGPTWTLESISTGDAVSSVPQGVVATLVFHDDGTVDVQTGCNSGGATWKAVGAGIEFGDLGLTKRACTGPEAQVEEAVRSVLQGTIPADIEANLLSLQGEHVGLQYRAGPAR